MTTTEDDIPYSKRYYLKNKDNINKKTAATRRMIRNSQPYIQQQQAVIIEQLNNGSKKWITEKCKVEYNIYRDPVSLKYHSLH